MIHRYLPEDIPLFPLTGVLLLPGMWLPLNVFEPRYTQMIKDALNGGKVLGMIQPLVPRDDNRGPVTEEVPNENPELYPIGCVGSIREWKETKKGDFRISLMGLSRFRLVEELPQHMGYRKAKVSYKDYEKDQIQSDEEVNIGKLLELLDTFGRENQIPFDTKRLVTVSGAALVNGLAMSLPFAAAEKQALLEAADLRQREELLYTLMGMGLDQEQTPAELPPTLN